MARVPSETIEEWSEIEIIGVIDSRHPPATQLSLDPVAVGQRSFQAVQNVGHTAIPLGPALSYGSLLERARLALNTTPGAGSGGSSQGEVALWSLVYGRATPN